ncbi:MAG: hypothetical protein Q8L90_03730 [Bacteroidota bacterium]|nr:hypothetical protein [Bacteroidota bacterium]
MTWFTPEQLNNGEEAATLKNIKKHKNVEPNLHSLLHKFKSIQETFRQLKYATIKQGDIPLSLEFQKIEMQYYWKGIKMQPKQRWTKLLSLLEIEGTNNETPFPIQLKNCFGIIKNHFNRNWNERIILWSSQTNDFGQNWIKPLALLFLFSFVCYIPVGFLTSDTLNYDKFANSWIDIRQNVKIVCWDNIRNWLVLLNPAHRIKDIDENIDKYSHWVYFWDLLGRVVISFFIFQTVSAFRKFHK